jgi:hypothetical protein
MNAYELADELDRIVKVSMPLHYITESADMLRKQADRIAELEFENKAFRDELFKRGSMDSCSQAAALHGFVSPRQAGDDAREYISGILEKAKNEQV